MSKLDSLLRILRARPENDLSRRVVATLRARGWSVAFAESCTGGQLSANLTAVPGSSSVVVGSAVCYQLRAKHVLLGITDVTEENVVSPETAKKMAEAAKRLFGADIGVGTTGFLDGERKAFWAIALPESVGGSTLCGGVKFDESSTREDNRRTLCKDVITYLKITTNLP